MAKRGSGGGGGGGRNKVRKVMGEFKRGTLRSGSSRGPRVEKRKQAVAIALSERRRQQANGQRRRGRR